MSHQILPKKFSYSPAFAGDVCFEFIFMRRRCSPMEQNKTSFMIIFMAKQRENVS